jgi:hypothetical protein
MSCDEKATKQVWNTTTYSTDTDVHVLVFVLSSKLILEEVNGL